MAYDIKGPRRRLAIIIPIFKGIRADVKIVPFIIRKTRIIRSAAPINMQLA